MVKMDNKYDAKSDEDKYENGVDELYRPFLIHPSTYMILTEQILTLMPPQRNVILSMNEYEIREINPVHPDSIDSPTHVIIFCIRFIADDIFQPIGGLLTYKHHNQCAVLAECLKAYINDLWKLGLYVVATVSPSFKIFKGILSHLVNVEDFDSHSDVISYAVEPIKEIIHIYDIQFLLIKLQNLFKEGNVHFKEDSITEKRIFEASWTDMSTVFSLYREFKVLAEFLDDNEEVSRRVHIFTEQILNCFLEAQSHEALSPKAEGCAVLLNCVRSFLKFTEKDFVDLDKNDYVDNWNDLIDMLKSLTFQKSGFWTCTKDKPSHIHHVVNPSIRRKIDFSNDEKKCRKDQESIDNTGIKKTKNKKNKKKKCVENKLDPRRMCQISEVEKLQSLAKIQELCAMLRETKSFEGVIETQVFERTNKVPNESPETLKTNSGHYQECHTGKYCDIDKNNNSDENINDNNNTFFCGVDENLERNINIEKIGTNSSPVGEKYISDTYYSKYEEETELIVNKHCDKIFNVIELLESNIEYKDQPPDFPEIVFEKNPVTHEMLCTILGMKKLLKLLKKRRVRLAKPDAFIIEHIDYLVKMIQEKNLLKSIRYYGHNYEFMNSALAFATLNNNKGLYLIMKD